MNKKILLVLGIGAIVLAYVLNLNYAADNYGIKTNSLSFSVLAQSGSSGGGSGSGGSSDPPKPKVKYCRSVNCVHTLTYEVDDDGCFILFYTKKCGYEPNSTIQFNCAGIKEVCSGGTEVEGCEVCKENCVPEYL